MRDSIQPSDTEYPRAYNVLVNSFAAVTSPMQKPADFYVFRKYRIVQDIIFNWDLPDFAFHRAVSSVELMSIWKPCKLLNSFVKLIQKVCRCPRYLWRNGQILQRMK